MPFYKSSNRCRELGVRKLMIASASIALFSLGACAAPSEDTNPSAEGSSESARAVKGSYEFRDGWCPKLDFKSLEDTLANLKVDVTEIEDSYVPDSAPAPDAGTPSEEANDGRLSSHCVVTNSKAPLDVTLDWWTQIYESPDRAEEDFGDRSRWPKSSLVPENATEIDVDGWKHGLAYKYAAESDENKKSGTWLLGQDSNLVVMVEAKKCSVNQAETIAVSCAEDDVSKLVQTFAREVQQALSKER